MGLSSRVSSRTYREAWAMGKYYCDYCDTYLTHDSRSVRKTHLTGRKHKDCVREYYQAWLEREAAKLIAKTQQAYNQARGGGSYGRGGHQGNRAGIGASDIDEIISFG